MSAHPLAAVSPEARATYELYRPAMEAAAARWARFQRDGWIPGDDAGTLRRRYQALSKTRYARDLKACVDQVLADRDNRDRRLASFATLEAAYPDWCPLPDDWLPDSEWAAMHPDRQYRVRPYRPAEDGPHLDEELREYLANEHPLRDFLFTVVHFPSDAWGRGVPPTILADFGFPGGPPVDEDAWAEHLFECCVATNEFTQSASGAQA